MPQTRIIKSTKLGFQLGSESPELFHVEATGGISVRCFRVVEEIAWFLNLQTVIDDGGKVLDGVAGVGKDEPIHYIGLAAKDKLQPQLEIRDAHLDWDRTIWVCQFRDIVPGRSIICNGTTLDPNVNFRLNILIVCGCALSPLFGPKSRTELRPTTKQTPRPTPISKYIQARRIR